MKIPNRDLLILFNQELMTPQAIQHEVDMLHEILYSVERIDSLVVAHELININKYRVSNKYREISSTFRQGVLKAFVFLNCKN
jgi:hypothetical protein